jgi:hypothetical protein
LSFKIRVCLFYCSWMCVWSCWKGAHTYPSCWNGKNGVLRLLPRHRVHIYRHGLGHPTHSPMSPLAAHTHITQRSTFYFVNLFINEMICCSPAYSRGKNVVLWLIFKNACCQVKNKLGACTCKVVSWFTILLNANQLSFEDRTTRRWEVGRWRSWIIRSWRPDIR